MPSRFTNYNEMNKYRKFPSLASKAKNKVIDVASDIMSFPARRNAQITINRNNANVKDMKLVKQAGPNTEPIPNDYRSELFRARANVALLKSNQYEALKKLKSIKNE